MPAKNTNPEQSDNTPAVKQDNAALRQSGAGGASAASSGTDFTELIRRLSEAGGVPIKVTHALPDRIDTAALLSDKKPVTVAFPPCAEELLALIKTTGIEPADKDEITKYFDEYFRFGQQHVIIDHDDLPQEIDSALFNCDFVYRSGGSSGGNGAVWPSECCFCSPCITLDGNRNALTAPPPDDIHIRRLFIGDLFGLFYYDRMGIYQILGAILDAYANNGRLPISNGSLDTGVNDDIIAVILEAMVRQTKMGMSSTVRDRASSYQTALGWVPDIARKFKLDTQVNTGFNTLFHKFIFNALEFYKDKRLAFAIQGTAAGVARPSVATLTTISDTIEVLKKRFEAFDYGRNYYNTLSGIVWMIAGMSVIRELRTTLGIPPAYNEPHEFIPAAYDLLVLKRPVTSGETNRYIVHRECARNGRDILLDLEVINHQDKNKDGELELWLDQIESKIEAYRTAYRSLTGVDLGASANSLVEQQV